MDDLTKAINETMADLEKLISIQSVSSQPEHESDVRHTADFIANALSEIGAADVTVVVEGGAPAVIAHFPAPEGQPTVCLYAHHDVQPVLPEHVWTSPAFTADVRDGRLYGRGSADDKGGVAVHLAALRAFDGKPPVGVTVFIEGEEEIGSPSLGQIIERHHDALSSDAFVIADAMNWEVGVPGLTNTLRGVVDCVVEVSTLAHGVHSGEYGGAVPDALTALCRLLATLHDEEGNVAIADLQSGKAAKLDYPVDRLAKETGLLPGVSQIGSGNIVDRLWTKPACSVIALDTTRIADASNTLIPTASAKVSLRVAPGDNAERALAALKNHLLANAPWGAQVSVRDGQTGQPGIVEAGKFTDTMREALAEAFEVDPVFLGCGGSIPMVADFQEAFPGAEVLITAVTDPGSRIHGIDESLDLGDWHKAVAAEALFLAKLAR